MMVTPFVIAMTFCLMLVGAGLYGQKQFVRRKERAKLKHRLSIDPERMSGARGEASVPVSATELAQSAARRAAEFYASSDPDNVVRIRHMLMRAGYMQPEAVGRYFLSRFIGMGAGLGLALGVMLLVSISPLTMRGLIIAGLGMMTGYVLPTLLLMQQIGKRSTEYRNGFPDFMDLMIVCADAGLSLEASIDRVAREISKTYPALSQNLILVSLELRAGRSIEETLRALSERLGVDEVRAFSTLLKQSRELGTSLAGTLRVFSDDMRHKRMARAEEKAHALPAKMTIPVTLCILPVVLMMAIIPTIVRYAG